MVWEYHLGSIKLVINLLGSDWHGNDAIFPVIGLAFGLHAA